MRIQSIKNNIVTPNNFLQSDKKETQKIDSQRNTHMSNPNLNRFDNYMAMLNRAKISFKGYYGDQQPAKKLFWNLTGRNDVYEDNWTNEHLYQVGYKKWVNASPNELLKRTPEQAMQSILTIVKPPFQYPGIPPCIYSPNYGDKWGRHANYIEINPRAIAKYDNGKVSEGLFQVMKLLPAIPPSPRSFANCILLSQVFPSTYGDGYMDGNGLYTANLHTGISRNLTSPGLYCKMGEDEQVKAFNDLAHLMGFKTGARMPLSAGQLQVQGRGFDWWKDERAYIDACKNLVDLGFDAIYFDSAKHVIDYNGYCGVGALPDFYQMQRITEAVRRETGRGDLAFIGEKCNDEYAYKEMGLTAGTHWGQADDFGSVLWESRKQKGNRDYAGGPEVSNDNDYGDIRYEQRLNRISNCLFGYDHIADKLPTYMQINDILPLSNYTNTHEQMERIKAMRGSDAWTECERHWDGIFNTDWPAQNYRNDAYHLFEHVMFR